MNLYNIIKYTAIGLSLLGIVFVLIILSDVLSGIDMILYNAYVVLFIIVTSVSVSYTHLTLPTKA